MKIFIHYSLTSVFVQIVQILHIWYKTCNRTFYFFIFKISKVLIFICALFLCAFFSIFFINLNLLFFLFYLWFAHLHHYLLHSFIPSILHIKIHSISMRSSPLLWYFHHFCHTSYSVSQLQSYNKAHILLQSKTFSVCLQPSISCHVHMVLSKFHP